MLTQIAQQTIEAPWWRDLAGLAALVTAVTGIPAAIIAARNSGKARTKIRHELNPNHGSSLRDQVDLLVKMVSSLDHQVGEIRQDAHDAHSRYDRQLERTEQRIDRLETSNGTNRKRQR